LLIFSGYNVGMKNQQTPSIVSQPHAARQQLKALGLTPEIISNIARAAAFAKAEALGVDPLSTPGTLAYIKGVREKRLQLLPLGWEMSRVGNVEATVNHSLGIQLLFQNVDMACTDRDPQSLSIKGSGSRNLVKGGMQAELWEHSKSPAIQQAGVVPTVWYVCCSSDDKRIRAEVSCPESFEGAQFDGFVERIWVVDEELASVQSAPPMIDDAVDHTYDVQISKK
jgi:hypothetical protein